MKCQLFQPIVVVQEIYCRDSGGFIVPVNNQKNWKKIIFIIKNYSVAKNKVLKAKKKLYKFSDINLIKYYKLLCDICRN